jgi:LacI family transcriptional regulator
LVPIQLKAAKDFSSQPGDIGPPADQITISLHPRMETFTFGKRDPRITLRPGRNGFMAVTIKDVAREAKVSVASASRALNGHPSVTVATRERILGVADKLRYVPHSGARSLITRRTQTIGALLPDLYGEFFSELIRGIDLAARARGLHLLVSSSHGNSEEARSALRAMHGRVDGLLVMSPHIDAGFLANNLPHDLPTVLMNTHVQGGTHSLLNVDNHGGAYGMVEHLVACGFQRIALISGPDNNYEAQERMRGYRDALAKYLPRSQEWILRGDFSEESGYRAGQAIAAAEPRPDAVFACNDMMAIGCLFALKDAGLQVPQDIALAGFDDIPIARYLTPPLSTVRVRIAELGAQALERLVEEIADRAVSDARIQTFRTELVIRSSCGSQPVAIAS